MDLWRIRAEDDKSSGRRSKVVALNLVSGGMGWDGMGWDGMGWDLDRLNFGGGAPQAKWQNALPTPQSRHSSHRSRGMGFRWNFRSGAPQAKWRNARKWCSSGEAAERSEVLTPQAKWWNALPTHPARSTFVEPRHIFNSSSAMAEGYYQNKQQVTIVCIRSRKQLVGLLAPGDYPICR
jgi:hypothetical protein